MVNLTQAEQDRLVKCSQAWETCQTKGWREVILPWLLARRDQTFPDPQNFTKEEDFTYAAKVVSVYKKVVSEILTEIARMEEEGKFLQKKASGEIENNPFAIGREEVTKDNASKS